MPRHRPDLQGSAREMAELNAEFWQICTVGMLVECAYLLVRPHARAGVEIARTRPSRCSPAVRPHARAGFEMTLWPLRSLPAAALPLRDGGGGVRVCGGGVVRLFVAGCGCALLGVFDFWGVLFSRCWFRCFCRSCCLYFGRRQGDVGGLLVWGLSLARDRMGRLMPGDRSNTHSR